MTDRTTVCQPRAGKPPKSKSIRDCYQYYRRSQEVAYIDYYLQSEHIPAAKLVLLKAFVQRFFDSKDTYSFDTFYRHHICKQDKEQVAAVLPLWRAMRQAVRYKKNYSWQGKKNFYVCSRKEYAAICKEFNQAMMEEVLEGREMQLPGDLGYLVVRKRKMDFDKLKINMKATKEMGMTIYYTNDHSRNFYYRFCWKRNTYLHHEISLFNFVVARRWKKQLSEAIYAGKDYLEL